MSRIWSRSLSIISAGSALLSRGLWIILASSAILNLSACSYCCKKDTCLTQGLGELQKLNNAGKQSFKVSVIRSASLRDAAMSIGARGGLAARGNQINCILLKNEPYLYRVFNFNGIMLDKSVLPPILAEGRNTLQLSGTDAIRISDRIYTILAQAKFVTAPPTWRDYLWMSFPSPDVPDRAMLPRTPAERGLWKKYIAEGWKCGIQQADLIFRERLSRLKRDFEGMLLYRTLLAQNMVSPPFVAELDMGVTGGGSDLTVNDRVLRITAFPALQNDSSNWKAEIIKYD